MPSSTCRGQSPRAEAYARSRAAPLERACAPHAVLPIEPIAAAFRRRSTVPRPLIEESLI